MKAKRFQVKKKKTRRITPEIKINCLWVIFIIFRVFLNLH